MAATALKETLPTIPKSRDIDLAKKASIEMGPFLSQNTKKDLQIVIKRSSDKEEIVFLLTSSVMDLLFRTLLQIAKGNAVTLVPIHAELTTQEAANLLNISRPYLIRLLDDGKIPYRKVGRHRRILFEDLLKYREKSKEKGRKARDELTKQAQELNLGY